MVSHKRKNQEAVYNGLLNSVRKGEISSERLNESLRRIYRGKDKNINPQAPQKSWSKSVLAIFNDRRKFCCGY